jgi:hypothetical protein
MRKRTSLPEVDQDPCCTTTDRIPTFVVFETGSIHVHDVAVQLHVLFDVKIHSATVGRSDAFQLT